MHDDTQTAGETRPAAVADNAASGGSRLRPVVLAGCAVLLLAACAGISLLVSQLAQPETVVFDMRGTVNAFKQQSAQMTLTPERAALLTTRFNNALRASLTDWQQVHNAVILEKGAVVSEAQDITPVIQTDIARQMHASQQAGGAPDLSGEKP
ncbi:type-F conjugative transfer system protein TrbI (plasmid) [Pantoea sp. JZ29]|uniref:type-F conjugative transfer system protein TrbI n=1 Tax=Pantoea sp. JZ29 TaxID=2654192 RepID=UPI002B48210D|nr:type-F conjugative transfer system protein TrbI [Pantoea sp. JZ29]WRH23445.1 type-F conjugative transfer system protein TrbI [Pantoea sp. JZ29]